MAGFVRAAAKERAQALLEREAPITLSQRDFSAFTQVAAFALIVDAKDDAANAFYEHYGFTPPRSGADLVPAARALRFPSSRRRP